jgi:hypothetical protein
MRQGENRISQGKRIFAIDERMTNVSLPATSGLTFR